MIQIVNVGSARIEKFNARPAFPEEAEKAAAEVLAAIKKDGDKAVRAYVAKFEGFAGKNLKVEVEVEELEKSIDPKLVKAVKDAHKRVLKFSKASLKKPWTMKTPRGGSAGEFYSPMDRVGVYIPGGTAPLASTSVMTVTLAKAAGVKEIVACTPAGKTGEVRPATDLSRCHVRSGSFAAPNRTDAFMPGANAFKTTFSMRPVVPRKPSGQPFSEQRLRPEARSGSISSVNVRCAYGTNVFIHASQFAAVSFS